MATAEQNSLQNSLDGDQAGLLAPRRGIPAWILSFLLHAVIFAMLLITIRQVPRGAAVEGDREAGIVLVQNKDEQAKYLTSGEMSAAGGDQADSTKPLSEALPAAESLPNNLLGALPSHDSDSGTGTGVESGLPGVDDLLKGVKPSKDIGGKVSTQVFGIQGTGSKFVYVFDRSASMSGFDGRPLRAAKEQLIASLKSLGPTQQFQIIFYNQSPRVFNPSPDQPPRLLYGTESNIKLAEKFINAIQGEGGTEHLPALQLAVGLSPDVIFFLTDAQEPGMSDSDLDKVERWNRSAASINSIEFGAGKSYDKNNFLVKLARRNFGQHAYKDVTQFGGQ